MYCGRCGAANPDGAEVRFCRTCGGRLIVGVERREPVLAVAGGSTAPAADPEFAPTMNGGDSVSPSVPAAETQPPAAPIAPGRSLARPSSDSPLPPVEMLMLVSPYGGFWMRFGASLLDCLVIGVFGSIASSVVWIAFGFAMAVDTESAQQFTLLAFWSLALIAFVISFVYYVVLPPLVGATPGKLALGYEIVGPDGRRVRWQRSLARYLATISSSLALGVGYAWIGVDLRKQGWHDKLAGTYVIRRNLVRK